MSTAIAVRQFRDRVVRPALKETGLWSETAERLLLGTAAQESNFRFLQQIGTGPAVGLYQIEPRTHEDLWLNWLRYRPLWNARARYWSHCANVPGLARPHYSELGWNLAYSTVMARLVYYRRPEPLPNPTPAGLAHYWKEHYNTHLGAGSVDEFVANYRRFVQPIL